MELHKASRAMRRHKVPPNVAFLAVLLESMGGSGPSRPENHATGRARKEVRQVTFRPAAPPDLSAPGLPGKSDGDERLPYGPRATFEEVPPLR